MQLVGPTEQSLENELNVIRSLINLDNANILELGCGAAEKTHQLIELYPTASITAAEVDQIQHNKNLAAPVPGVTFKSYGAESIEEDEETFDGIMMFKSLHHVPVELLDRAFAEIARVLKPGGWLYISEPVFAGAFNEVIRVFHDEEYVRKEAFGAIQRAVAGTRFKLCEERFFLTPLKMTGFAQFEDRLLNVTHTHHNLTDEQYSEVKRRFEANLTDKGYVFEVPNRVDFLRTTDA